MSAELKVLLLAGEESGLVYADRLRAALTARAACPIVFRGYQSEGFKTGDLAVMGFGAVVRKIFYFLRVQRTMKAVIRTWRPYAVVTVDYPGLNLKLAAYAKRLGIPAIHIVCPQVWAWHQNRIPKIAAALTKLLCFFPFEPALFAGTGLAARFIGHPMLDVFAEEDAARPAANGTNAASARPVLAVLPGSRLGEIQRILPRLLRALPQIAASAAPFEVVIPAANEKAAHEIQRQMAFAAPCPVAVRVQQGDARGVLRGAVCAVVASGTATLEAALARCPTVLVYAVSPALAWFARRVIKSIRHIGIANVVWEKCQASDSAADDAPMPELLQEDFTPEAVAAKLSAWLSDPTARACAAARLDETRTLLRSDGHALDRAAEEILETIRESGHAH